jgi:SAM-dependent methyltransferase
MNYHRYRLALDHCAGKDVLEVACGFGQGLGLLARRARRVVGGDYTESLVRKARAHYEDRLPVLRLDGQAMPFKSRSFDVVILFEALYYLPKPEAFLAECRRVLRAGGTLLLSTVNPEWPDFNPSPLSARYFSATELAVLLRDNGFETALQGAFPVERPSVKGALVSSVKRAAVSLNLIPGSMKGKRLLKRIFYGRLIPLSPELTEGAASFKPPENIASGENASRYRVIYAVARPEAGRGAAPDG